MRFLIIFIVILTSGFADSTGLSGMQDGKSIKKIDSLIPSEYEVLDIDSAFVNEDNCLDYLIALKKKNEQEDECRPLLFFMSKNDSCGMQLEFRNDSALYSSLDGPYSGFDCFVGIELEKDSITIEYYGGMSTRWSETHQFLFNKQLGKHLLTSIDLTSDNIYDDEDPDEYQENFENERISLDTLSIFRYPFDE